MENSKFKFSNFNSTKILLEEYFKDLVLYDNLEDFHKSTNHLENMQIMVGCFINVGYSQTPNVKMQIDTLKKLRIYLKHNIQMFYSIYITIHNSVLKGLLSEKHPLEFKKATFIIFSDFLKNYESFEEIDYLNIFNLIFKSLVEIIVKETDNNENNICIPKVLMNYISQTLFFTEIYSLILDISNSTRSTKHLEIYLNVLESLLVNTPKTDLYNVVDWNNFFKAFFEREILVDLNNDNLYLHIFMVIKNLLYNGLSGINLDENTEYKMKEYIDNLSQFKVI